MRQLCVAFAMLGPVVACGSEYSSRDARETSSPEVGGATAVSSQATEVTAGGSSSTPVQPPQGGAIGSTGGSASSGGAAASGGGATGGVAGSGAAGAASVAGSTSLPVRDCGLPTPITDGVAKPAGVPGNLRVVDWAGFHGAVSFTMDDNNSSQRNNYAKLNGLGIPLTFYLWCNNPGSSDPVWAQAVKDGHELGNHTQNHTQKPDQAGIDQCATFIQSHFGVRTWDLAAPYGDASYGAAAEGKYLTNRGVFPGNIKPNDTTDALNLPSTIPSKGALASEMNKLVDDARRAGGWQIILVHGFTGDSGAYNPVDYDEFAATVRHAETLGDMWLDTVMSIGSYWVAQKALTAAQQTTTATEMTYTWTLPTPFPSGKCLRITVDGGTVKQAGEVLAWDTHGYYEISLDVGSVTISP